MESGPIKTILSLNCEQASRLLSEDQDVELYWWERLGLRVHLLYCGYCKRYQKQLGLLRLFFRDIFSNDELAGSELKLSETKRSEIKKIISDRKNFGK